MPKLTKRIILNAVERENEFHKRINETFIHRHENDVAWNAWEKACASWHESVLPTDFLWEESAKHEIKNGNRDFIESAILFLEVDPWFFRSGYLKERVIQALKQATLNEEDKNRLRQVIINVMNGKNRRELRNFCSLAKALWTSEFEGLIKRELLTASVEVKCKLSYLLKFIHKNKR